jgi:hypothetical protein
VEYTNKVNNISKNGSTKLLWRLADFYMVISKHNMSEWSDMSIRGLLFQWASIMQIQLSVFVQNKADLIIISLTNFIVFEKYWEIPI